MSSFIFGVSLTGSFLAGILALFAPCCITILFPSYLGTIFKKTEKVFFYTGVFALGLAAVLMPVALGFRFIVSLFDRFHQQFYFLAAIFLIIIGLMTYFEMKMPSFLSRLIGGHSLGKANRKIDIASVFSLGVMSGISSSCCAPVLFAAITLTSLSPTLFQAVLVSSAYVLGIVFPLFILSLFYEKISSKFLSKTRKRVYQFFKSLAAAIFIVSGLFIGVLAYLNKIEMGQMAGYSRSLRLLVFHFSRYFQNPLIDLLSFGLIVYLFYRLLKRKEKRGK